MTRFVGTPLRGTEFSAPSDEAVSARVAGDTIPRFRIDAGGRITWGDGTAAGDVKLYRATTGAIVTDGYFSASGGLQTSAVSASPTVSLPNGALIVDNGSNSLYFRANDQWIAAGAGQGNASLTVSDTPPAEPASGDLWFESDSAKTFVYYDSFWVEVGGGSSTYSFNRYYGSFYDTTTLSLTSASTAYALPLNASAESDGVSIVSDSRITVANAGVYNIQFSAQLDKTDAGSDLVNIWFSKNGINIPYSNTQVTVTGGNGKYLASWNFVLTLAANDYVQIMIQSPDTHMRVVASGVQSNPARPEVPSTIVTVTQVQ